MKTRFHRCAKAHEALSCFLGLAVLCAIMTCCGRPFDKYGLVKECGIDIEDMRLPLNVQDSLVRMNNQEQTKETDTSGLFTVFSRRNYPEELSFLHDRNLDTCSLCLWNLNQSYDPAENDSRLRGHYLSYGLELAGTPKEALDIILGYARNEYFLDCRRQAEVGRTCLPYVKHDRWLGYLCRKMILEGHVHDGTISSTEMSRLYKFARKNVRYSKRLWGTKSASYSSDYALCASYAVFSGRKEAVHMADSIFNICCAAVNRLTGKPHLVTRSELPVLWRYYKALEENDIQYADTLLTLFMADPFKYFDKDLKEVVGSIKKRPYGEGDVFGDLRVSKTEKNMHDLQGFEADFEKARLLYLSGDSAYAEWLHQGFIAGATRLFPASSGEYVDELIRPDRMNDPLLSSLLAMQYNHPSPEEAYDAALFIKGTGNSFQSVMYRAVRDRCSDETLAYVDSVRHFGIHGYECPARKELENTVGHDMPEILLPCLASWQDIESALNDGQAAIEFIRVPSMEYPVTYSYRALALKKGFESPVAIDLGAEKDLAELIASDAHFESDGFYSYGLRPLVQYIEGTEEVFYSMDGLLNICNLSSFRLPDGGLAGDRYRMIQLSSTKEILNRDKDSVAESITLFGGLDYVSPYGDGTASPLPDRQLRGKSFNRDICRGDFGFLPFSEKEVDDISCYASEKGIQTREVKGSAGSEEAFYALDGTADGILHISTHGFYYGEKQADRMAFFKTVTGLDNPLSRCGLILAHGQNAWSGKDVPEWAEDGILLGSEIAECDLSGVDLVVLSACDTAVGDISAEGVSGLRQAFKRAGAGSMIVTLSKVDDEATSVFMQHFYGSLFSGNDARSAYDSAIEHMRESQKFGNPSFWSPFILID